MSSVTGIGISVLSAKVSGRENEFNLQKKRLILECRKDYVTLRLFQPLIDVTISILEKSCFLKIFTSKNDLTYKNLFLKAKWYTRSLFSNVLMCKHLGKRTANGKSPPWVASNS